MKTQKIDHIHIHAHKHKQRRARTGGGQERHSISVCTQIATIIMIIITIEMNPRNYLNARMTKKNNETTTTKFFKNNEFSRIFIFIYYYLNAVITAKEKINCDVIILWFGKVARACCLQYLVWPYRECVLWCICDM